MRWIALAFLLTFLVLMLAIPAPVLGAGGSYIPTPNNLQPILSFYPPPGKVITLMNGDLPPGGYVTWLADNTSRAAFYLSGWGHSPKNLVEFNSHGIGKYRLKR